MKDKKREDYIEEKTREAIRLRQDFFPRYNSEIDAYKDFIRTLLNEAPMRKPKVNKEWVAHLCVDDNGRKRSVEDICDWLEEAGMEVEGCE